MRYTLFPTQDASLFEDNPNLNTGADELLYIGKTDNGTKRVRSAIQFDLTQASNIPLYASYSLSLFFNQVSSSQLYQEILICPMSSSWTEGSGYYNQTPINTSDGITWNQMNSGSFFLSGSEGGSVITNISASSSLTNLPTGITFDITSIAQSWISGTYPNNGLLILFPTGSESDITNQGNIQSFSRQTHTIYSPILNIWWNDQIYITGSNSWPTSNLVVIPSTLKSSYFQNEIVQVDLNVRELYPLKTFATTASNYSGNCYLPTSSYFSIIDEKAGLTIIPFGSSSLISSNGNNSYFNFQVQNMYPLRYYRIIIKVDHDGLSEIFDNNSIFNVKALND